MANSSGPLDDALSGTAPPFAGTIAHPQLGAARAELDGPEVVDSVAHVRSPICADAVTVALLGRVSRWFFRSFGRGDDPECLDLTGFDRHGRGGREARRQAARYRRGSALRSRRSAARSP